MGEAVFVRGGVRGTRDLSASHSLMLSTKNRSEERSLVCKRRRLIEASEGHLTHLLENVLLSHQLLPLPVGLGEDHFEDVLTRVGAARDEVDQVLQQLGD